MKNKFAIIEIGSNNTKIHIYKNNETIYDEKITIEFKKNYKKNNKIISSDLEKLEDVIKLAKEKTDSVYLYGCSIFRKLKQAELDSINKALLNKYNVSIEVISQEEEARLTALGCYNDISYDKNICIFIGGGGSTELLLVNNKKILEHHYYDFGVVDITDKFPSLKEDIPKVSLKEVTDYISTLIDDLDFQADLFILAGGDHLYWYENASFKCQKNTLYTSVNQPLMLDIKTSNKYDREAFKKSLDEIRNRSDNPAWFDGARSMKAITNYISNKIGAKYIIPTKVNMELGLKYTKEKSNK